MFCKEKCDKLLETPDNLVHLSISFNNSHHKFPVYTDCNIKVNNLDDDGNKNDNSTEWTC